MDNPKELPDQLRAPAKWCCIFMHEGFARHGETEAPFKAADLIADLSAQLAEVREVLSGAREYVADTLDAHEHSDGRELLTRIDTLLTKEPK